MEIKMETRLSTGMGLLFQEPPEGPRERLGKAALRRSPGSSAAPARASRVGHAGNGLRPRPSPDGGGGGAGSSRSGWRLVWGTAVLALTASRMAQGQGSTA